MNESQLQYPRISSRGDDNNSYAGYSHPSPGVAGVLLVCESEQCDPLVGDGVKQAFYNFISKAPLLIIVNVNNLKFNQSPVKECTFTANDNTLYIHILN